MTGRSPEGISACASRHGAADEPGPESRHEGIGCSTRNYEGMPGVFGNPWSDIFRGISEFAGEDAVPAIRDFNATCIMSDRASDREKRVELFEYLCVLPSRDTTLEYLDTSFERCPMVGSVLYSWRVIATRALMGEEYNGDIP